MARAGSARYDIEAEDRFSRVLDRAGRGFTDLQANVVTANAAFQLGAIAARAFAGSLNQLYNDGAQVVDRQAKVAAAIATTTEYLEAAQYAAGLNGIAVEQVEKSYLKMTDAIGEAADGTITYKRALDKLGLDAEALKLKGTQEQYAAISEAFEGIGNQAERVQIARTIFGRQGAFLIRNTAEQIETARKEMDSFGISTSRVDASKVEAANDAMFRLQTVTGGAKKEFSAGLAPAVETVAEAILGAAKGTVDFEIASQRAGLAVIKSVGVIATGYQAVDGVVKTVVLGALRAERAVYQIQATFGAGLNAEVAAEKVQVVTAQMDKLAEAARNAFKLDAQDNIIAAYEKNIADAIAQAEKLEAARLGSNDGGTFNADEDAGKTRERVNAQIAALSDQLATEDEMISRSLAKRLTLIDEYEKLNTDKKREADILRDGAENEAIARRRELRTKEAEEIAKEQAEKTEKLSGLESRISQIRGGFEAEKALIIEQEEERQELIREYAEITQLTKQETDQLYIESERRKVKELKALRDQDAANSAKVERDKQASVIGYLEKGLAAAAGRSRKAFEAQKALDIGRALIAGKVAAVEAFKWGNARGGLAVGAAAAAASLLATGSIIQSIDGRSFGNEAARVADTQGEAAGTAIASTNTGSGTTINQYIIAGNPSLVDRETFKEFVAVDVEEATRSGDLTFDQQKNQFTRNSEAA